MQAPKDNNSPANLAEDQDVETRPATHERILVVDDSTDIRHTLRQLLPMEGYEVLTARSGEEGLLLAQELTPDLIIADYQMPGLNGLEMWHSVRERGIDVPMILMTAKGSEALAVEALRAGIRDYLIKPFTAQDILDSVHRVLTEYWAEKIKERLPAHLLEANRRLEHQIRALTTLVRIGKSVTGMLDVQQVLNEVVEAAVKVTGADESSLLLVDHSSGELYMRAERNFDQKTAQTLRLKVEDSLAGQVIQTGKPVILSGDELVKINTAYLVKSLIYVPLQLKDKVIGVLSVDTRHTARTFAAHEVQTLSILADFAAVAVENASLVAEIVHERNTLDAILRDTEDQIIVVDSNDCVLFCNPIARQTFGVTITEFAGKPLHDVIDNAEVLRLFSREPLSGRGRHSEINLNNGERTLNAQLTIIDGVGRAAVMQDITHIKDMVRAKNDFVATVSHDLRSPLTAIMAYIALVERLGPLNEQQHQYLDQITVSVKLVTVLITELLELGRIEAGFDVDFEPVSLEEIVRESAAIYAHQTESQSLKLEFAFSPSLPQVLGNPIRLRQVINNLLGNAIKYTPQNGHIRLALYPDDQAMVLEVTDNGIGIPIEDQPFVFDKFYRTSKAIDGFEGSGLGLAIVKGIVEQHSGRIWLKSKPNEGTTFTVVLPVASAHTEPM